MSGYQKSLLIFRRDLRLYDHSALNAALSLSRQVIPCFIADPKQISKHPYQSQPGLQFMLQSLADLQQQLQVLGAELALFYADPEQVITELFTAQHIEAVFVNRDYTPFSRHRDHTLALCCQRLGIAFHYLPDALLTEPEQMLKADQSPYKVFTAFYNKARTQPVPLPQPLPSSNFFVLATGFSLAQIPFSANNQVMPGGRGQAMAVLDHLRDYADYQNQRDFPALSATSQLSAHLKFGTCSVREVFYAINQQLGSEHPLLRQLYWRDFFSHLGFHFPTVFGRAFIEKFANVPWDNNLEHFQTWCQGKTGFPIVDAGMRELNATGFMHNRVRMIVASFLVKDLHIDWRWGERYFAQHLVDYDPCINNGNWQWAASTGCDAQPYFRIFNPWLQQKKFDPDCQYIYRWLPEMRAVPVNIIQQWDKKYCAGAYPKPMLNHGYESQQSKERFQSCLQ